jgi:hypothetical protein
LRELRGLLRKHWALALVTAASAIVFGVSRYLTRGGVPLPPDSLEYAGVARSLVLGKGYTINLVEIHPGLLPGVRHLHELHGLLEPLLLAPLFWLDGASAPSVNVPGLLFVALLALVTFGIARRARGDVAGLLAAGMVLVDGDIAFDAALGGDDVGWALFSTLSLLCFLRTEHDSRARAALSVGIAAALATLQKVSGAVLPVVFVAMLLGSPGPLRVKVRRWLFIAGPVAAAVAMYAVRNVALHGGVGFRYSALDWLSKVDPRAYFAYYPVQPTVGDAWRTLGTGKLLRLIGQQVLTLGSVVAASPLFFVGGLGGLVYSWRDDRALALFGLTYSLVLAVVVCAVYHVEARYLLALHPVFFTAIACLIVDATRRLAETLPRAAHASFRVLVCALALASFGYGLSRIDALERAMADAFRGAHVCDDAIAFIRARTGKEEPILTSSPWFVAWATERPAVNVPTNPEGALSVVARHYGARWALTGLPSYGTADVDAALSREARTLRPERVFDGPECDVYRLR